MKKRGTSTSVVTSAGESVVEEDKERPRRGERRIRWPFAVGSYSAQDTANPETRFQSGSNVAFYCCSWASSAGASNSKGK